MSTPLTKLTPFGVLGYATFLWCKKKKQLVAYLCKTCTDVLPVCACVTFKANDLVNHSIDFNETLLDQSELHLQGLTKNSCLPLLVKSLFYFKLWLFKNLLELCNTPTFFISALVCEFTHFWGFWICSASLKWIDKLNYRLFECHSYIYPASDRHSASVCLSPLRPGFGIAPHNPKKLGRAQMDQLLYRHADMSEAVIVLHKMTPCVLQIEFRSQTVLSLADLKDRMGLIWVGANRKKPV